MKNNQYHYRVQVGIFRDYNKAMDFQMRLLTWINQVEIKRQGDYYEVQVGDFDNLEKAVMLEQYLRMVGFHTLLVAI